ncbi:hypothetical protein SESBI_41770 [Sesbania bispinosa]|nr:hypothetical protein SESBI_41770 [Sesbania bispinosa]
MDEEDLDNLPYGQWMRTSPLRPSMMSKPATQPCKMTFPKKLFDVSGHDDGCNKEEVECRESVSSIQGGGASGRRWKRRARDKPRVQPLSQ